MIHVLYKAKSHTFVSSLLISLTLFLVFLSAMLILSVATGNIQIHSPERLFSPIYLLHRNEASRKYTTSLLVQNSTGLWQYLCILDNNCWWFTLTSLINWHLYVVVDSDLSGFIHNLESQDIKVEMMKKTDYMSAAPVSAAINVTGSSKVRKWIACFHTSAFGSPLYPFTLHSLNFRNEFLNNGLFWNDCFCWKLIETLAVLRNLYLTPPVLSCCFSIPGFYLHFSV